MFHKLQEMKADSSAKSLYCSSSQCWSTSDSWQFSIHPTIPMPQFPISGILAVAACGSGDHGASELVGRFISLSTDPSLV